MAESEVEHEICGNCKKEIPHYNYVMHTAHCARNLVLCKICKEPTAKNQYKEHLDKCTERSNKRNAAQLSKTHIEDSTYFQTPKEILKEKKTEAFKKFIEKHGDSAGYTLGSSKNNPVVTNQNANISSISTPLVNKPSSKISKQVTMNTSSNNNNVTTSSTGAIKKGSIKPNDSLKACKHCKLELPVYDLLEHEEYCGCRTDKCLECGEMVMFKNKISHVHHNNGQKSKKSPSKSPSWDSNNERINTQNSPRRRFEPTIYTELNQFDATDYLPSNYRIPKPKIEKGESYKEISRRLDCKTEYIRNLLHDSASITVPLRHNGTVPRNHFYHNTDAPSTPTRRKNPPTELCIPCEFCDTPIPHKDLIQHETGCRPDLACYKGRMTDNRDDSDEEVTEVELPCEFCEKMIRASLLLNHQATCN